MIDPITSLTAAIDNASKVANTPLFTTIIDKLTGFKISRWAAEGEIRKKLLHDEYEKAKESGIIGVQYIENLRHTTNLISAAAKSSKYINDQKPNDIKIDNDFFWNTMEHAKTISNEEVQELVAKIIAGEYNSPGTYSMSTLQTLKMMGRHEIELFENLCSFCINSTQLPKEVFAPQYKSILSILNVNFSTLQELQSIGLVLPNEMTMKLENPENMDFELKYLDRQVIFKSKNAAHPAIQLPDYWGLSTTGKQILRHLKPKFIEEYYYWLTTKYRLPNYEVIENQQ